MITVYLLVSVIIGVIAYNIESRGTMKFETGITWAILWPAYFVIVAIVMIYAMIVGEW